MSACDALRHVLVAWEGKTKRVLHTTFVSSAGGTANLIGHAPEVPMARAKVCLLNIPAPWYDSKSRGQGWVADPHIRRAPYHVQACCKAGRATSQCSACVLAHSQNPKP